MSETHFCLLCSIHLAGILLTATFFIYSAQQRSASAKKAAAARWGKKGK